MSGRGWLLVAVSIVVVIAIGIGFSVLGTPGAARKAELDKKRIEDLTSLSNELGGLDWRPQPQPLPESLDGLNLRTRVKTSLNDPETGKPYAYRRLAADRFELCATFATAVKEKDLEDWQKEWAHPAGPHCFTFVVKRGLGAEMVRTPAG